MKSKLLSLAAAAMTIGALSLGSVAATGTAQAHVGYTGLGQDYSWYKNGISAYRYRKICERLHYNWKVLGNPRAKELFLKWNCFKYVGIYRPRY